MRTTLTLDDDVAVHLERLRAQKGQSLKVVVNEVLRAGLTVIEEPAASRSQAYSTPPVSGGKPAFPSLDNIGEVLALIEGDAYK